MIKIGDKVKLKGDTSNPMMTVTSIYGYAYTRITCSWFVESKLFRDTFDVKALDIYK